jgi:hypothetical protein
VAKDEAKAKVWLNKAVKDEKHGKEIRDKINQNAAEGKDEAFIVDFVHEWDREDPVSRSGKSGPLLSADRARRKAYQNLGFKEVRCHSISELPFLDRSVEQSPTVQAERRRPDRPGFLL